MDRKVNVLFGEWIQEGFELYKKNLWLLILVTLIAFLLSIVTVGILAGPMFAGVILITLRLRDSEEPKPPVGDVFNGFQYFLNAFLFTLVVALASLIGSFILGLVPCIGFLVGILYQASIGALVMFGLFLIADKNMDFWPAITESVNLVKLNFWAFLGFSIVAGLIGSIGAIACGVGVIVTMPLYFCIVAVAYRQVFGGGQTPEELSQMGEEPEGPAATTD